MKRSTILAFAAAATLLAGAAVAQVTPAITAAVHDAGRPAADTMRDAERKPDQALAMAGVRPGEKIVELFPGGGYYTRILSKAVGPTGHVYALVPDKPAPRNPTALPDAMKAYPNVTVVTGPFADFKPPEKVDMVWTSENYHDFRIPMFGSLDPAALNNWVAGILKPRGVYYIEDHVAAPGAGASVAGTLHRIEPATIQKEVEAAGFRLQIKSDFLAHPEDDHTKAIFDPSVRGKTDRTAMKFVKNT